MNELQENSRNYVIDNAKLICLFLILYFHLPGSGGYFRNLAYSFHVPIFFFIAGVFFKNYPVKDVVIRSAKTLLIPYFVFNFFQILCSCSKALFITNSFSLENTLISPLLGIIFGCSGYASPFAVPRAASWFLVALFFARTFFAIMLHSSKKLIVLEVLALICTYFFVHYQVGWGLFSLDGTVLGMPFLIIGYYARSYVSRFVKLDYKWRIFIITLCSILLVPLVFVNGACDMWSGLYGTSFVLFLLCGLIGIIMVIGICSFLNYSNKITRLFIGGSTFFICMHIMIVKYVQLAYKHTISITNDMMVIDKILISVFVVFVCGILLLVIKKYLANRMKHFLFGKSF